MSLSGVICSEIKSTIADMTHLGSKARRKYYILPFVGLVQLLGRPSCTNRTASDLGEPLGRRWLVLGEAYSGDLETASATAEEGEGVSGTSVTAATIATAGLGGAIRGPRTPQ